MSAAAARVARRRLERVVADAFTWLTYHRSTYWHDTRWLGAQAVKSPLDLWVYQEIVWETRPDVILETGTHRGASALFLASICDLVGTGRVVSIDLNEVSDSYPRHPRIEYVGGRSSLDAELPAGIEHARTMVVLDSDHSFDHVLAELERFGPLVAPGCYLVVEDTAVGGRPVERRFGPGPAEAVERFLSTHLEFEVDRSREKFLSTFNPGGYLRRREVGGSEGRR